MTRRDWLLSLKPEDKVTRMLAGVLPQSLVVTEVTDTLIECGAWEFDRATGMEVDDVVESGPSWGVCISYLVPSED